MKPCVGRIWIVLFFCSLLMGCSIRIDLTTELPTQGATATKPQPIKTLPVPSETLAVPRIPANWSTYHNDEIGFEISFPGNYSALDDAEDLSGWKDGVVLLYNGGQSYDIVIQLWDNQQEYVSEFSNRMQDIVIHKIGNQFLTIMNVTKEPENVDIIVTFCLIK